MFDPKPGEIYRHDNKGNRTVMVIGWDGISSKIAPAVRCATYVDGERGPDASIWLDVLHNNYTKVG